MTGLTAEQKKTLDELIGQYGISLDRSEDESEIRKSIEEKSETLGIKKGHFRALAKAVWKGAREIARADLSDQLDLFELYGDFERDQVNKGLAKLKKHGLVSATYTRAEALQ